MDTGIDVQALYLEGFSQKGAVRVLEVHDKNLYEAPHNKVLKPKWYGKSANGEAFEGAVSRIIEKPGFQVVRQIRETGIIPTGEKFDHLCFYVAIQALTGSHSKDPDGTNREWNVLYGFYETLKKSKAHMMMFPNFSLATSDSPVGVDLNSHALYFPISHDRCIVFREASAPMPTPAASRINWLTYKHAVKYVLFHPKSTFDPK